MSTTGHFPHTMAVNSLPSLLLCFMLAQCVHQVNTVSKDMSCYGLWIPKHSSASNL